MIIDFHTHTFPSRISERVIEQLGKNGHVAYFTGASAEGLAEEMRESGTDLSVNLPVMTRPDQVVQVNDGLIRRKEELRRDGIITFGGLHPDFPDYAEEIRRLKEHGIPGIKLHPAFQGAQINDLRYKRIFAAASEAGLITLVHCGLDVGFMDHNYAEVAELLDVIGDVRPEKLVLAHMGGWQAWDEVERDLAGAPVWLDTSYSLGPVAAREGEEDLMPYKENLTQEAFVRIVRKHGTNRVLFATDCPWARQKPYIEFVRNSGLDDEEQEQVFYANAAALLGECGCNTDLPESE